MIIVNTDALKQFLIVNLSKLCEADPAALTKYVLALLKKDRPFSELREFLLDQLEVFLLKDTAPFVDLLLQALKTKSYIENALEGASKPDCSPQSSTNGVSIVPILSTESKKTQKIDSKVKEECHFERTSNNEKEIEIPPKKEVESRENHERERNRKTKPMHSSPSPKTKNKGSVLCASQDSSTLSEPVHTTHSVSSSMSRENIPVERERPVPSNNYIQRCENYDRLGYCLKGSLCAFDHGCDPILVEDVSALNFNVCSENIPFEDGPSKSPLPPLPTTSPPPLPPLPPPTILDGNLGASYDTEPYDPESPCMGPYYNEYFMQPSGPQRIKHQRTRELIGVPTINSVSLTREIKNDTSENHMHTDLKRKSGFDFSRLGPPNKCIRTESVLELRKVPSNLNNISMLNSHFSKFGHILNIEVAYDNDPEAALVKFSSPMEAANAYRSSVAVCNNRFIKVFYHSASRNQDKRDKDCNANSLTVEKMENNSDVNTFPEKSPESTIHSKYSSDSRKGSLTRTVFIPMPERVYQRNPLLSPENHLRDIKKEKNPIEKQLELLRKKQDFLNDSINHQKIVLQKLMKCKKKKEAEFLKKTIETIASKISSLKSEIQKESEALKKQLTYNKAGIINKTEGLLQKELLDAEMDMYRERKAKITHAENKETVKLLSQVNELKQKAKVLGLIDGTLPPQASAKQTHGKIKKHSIHAISRPRPVNPEILGDDEEEEDEEDSEARSWRR